MLDLALWGFDIRRNKADEWMRSLSGHSWWRWSGSGIRSGFGLGIFSFLCLLCLSFSVWVSHLGWLKASSFSLVWRVRGVSPAFSVVFIGELVRPSDVLAGASQDLQLFSLRIGLLWVRSGDVCKGSSRRTCQPRLHSLVAAHAGCAGFRVLI